MTLYNINDYQHLVFDGIHLPAHCRYCERLGDWLCLCHCGGALHAISDDNYYSESNLDIHFYLDVDTVEVMED